MNNDEINLIIQDVFSFCLNNYIRVFDEYIKKEVRVSENKGGSLTEIL